MPLPLLTTIASSCVRLVTSPTAAPSTTPPQEGEVISFVESSATDPHDRTEWFQYLLQPREIIYGTLEEDKSVVRYLHKEVVSGALRPNMAKEKSHAQRALKRRAPTDSGVARRAPAAKKAHSSTVGAPSSQVSKRERSSKEFLSKLEQTAPQSPIMVSDSDDNEPSRLHGKLFGSIAQEMQTGHQSNAEIYRSDNQYKSQLEDYKSTVKTLRRELMITRQRHEQQLVDIQDEHSVALKKMRQERDKAISERHAAESRANGVKHENARLLLELQGRETLLRGTKEALSKASGELEESRLAWNEERNEYEASLQRIKQQERDVQDALNHINDERSVLREQSSTLEASYADALKRIIHLEKAQESAKVRIEEHEAKNDLSQKRIAGLESEKRISELCIDKLEDSVDTKRERIDDLESDLNSSHARVAELEDALKKAENHSAALGSAECAASRHGMRPVDELHDAANECLELTPSKLIAELPAYGLESDLAKSAQKQIDIEGTDDFPLKHDTAAKAASSRPLPSPSPTISHPGERNSSAPLRDSSASFPTHMQRSTSVLTEDQRRENLQRSFLHYKNRYNAICAACRQVMKCFEGMDLANLGKLGRCIDAMRRVVEEEKGPDGQWNRSQVKG